MINRPAGTFVAVLLVAAACGCGNPDKEKMELGVNFACSTLDAANRNPMAAASYGSMAEMGGTVFSYLAANAPDSDDLPAFTAAPEKPWGVVVKAGPGPGEYTVEGYGTDLAKPLVSRTVRVVPMKMQ